MTRLVFDLETIPDPSLPPLDPKPDGSPRFPPPPYHQIVCVACVVLADDCTTKRLTASVEDEPSILRRFGALGASKGTSPRLVSFNGRHFDIPVIVARSFLRGAPFPWLYQTKDARYRYSVAAHEDLLEELTERGAADRASLDVWAQACGWPGKLGASGANVEDWYHRGQHDLIASYCLADAVQTAAVALRLWLVREDLGLEEYRTAARSLYDAALADERTKPLATRVDVGRWLLTAPKASEVAA